MRLAVLDGSDDPILVWDDNVVAKQVLEREIAQRMSRKRSRILRRPKTARLEDYEEAVRTALHDLSLQVARL